MRDLRVCVLLFLFCSLAAASLSSSISIQADAGDAWWNDAWPYRIPVTVTGSGVAQASIDFTAAFDTLGLNGALLDIRSLRVVPYSGTAPGVHLAHEETYSTMLHDGETTNGWSVNDDGSVVLDSVRYTEGSASVRTTITNTAGGYGYPGAEFHPSSITDWSPYETLAYDVWPEVNASALDQAPDLYWFKLYNACAGSSVTQGGPPLALDEWNYASVSLEPLDNCWPADGLNLSNITRIEFHTRDNETVHGRSGLWDDGDVLTLWLDNLRLVDQDGGVIKWQPGGSTSRYYVYFDVLAHEGHPQPTLTSLEPAALSGTTGSPEAGGYYHQIAGASTGGLSVWTAPTVEKILKAMSVPIASAPLRIAAARGEFEPFQIVVRSPSSQSLTVGVSDFVKGSDVITDVTVHRVDYVNITTSGDHFDRFGWWPDPLWPLANGDTVSFPGNENQPLWFTVRVPWDAAAGIYQATVTVGDASIPLELEVWNFSLPREIHLVSEWGFGWSHIVEDVYQGTADDWDCYWEMVEAFKQDFIDHRLIPKGLAWPAGLNHPGGVEYDCDGNLDPDAWGDWDFATLGGKYIHGRDGFNDGYGFPVFLSHGPTSNEPPDSLPHSFCGVSRSGVLGSAAFQAKWKQYLSAVDDYIMSASYAGAAYYHIVNEPQTFDDYTVVGQISALTEDAAPHLRQLVSEQVEPELYTYPGARIDIWMPTISNYEPVKSHDRQENHGEEVWWYYLYGDDPPLPNPILMSHPGVEVRVTPWLAWIERVDGLLHYSTTDWDHNPWDTPNVTDEDNGDAFFFYPPRKDGGSLDYCGQNGHRLVPSIRWELLREGMEDYEYLWLLNGGDPEIGVPNEADALAQRFIASRTLFSRVPTDLYETRAAIAAQLTDPSASKSVDRSVVAKGETLHYLLVYQADNAAHTVVISDVVPSATTVLKATGSKNPEPSVAGQLVRWEVPVSSQETVMLTIEARGESIGYVTNNAVFSGTQRLHESATVFVAKDRLYLPIVLKQEK